MTLPFERTNALINARQFMLDLMDSSKTPKVPLEIRRRARSVLKHFPSLFDLAMVTKRSPEVFGELETTLDDELNSFLEELNKASVKSKKGKKRGTR